MSKFNYEDLGAWADKWDKAVADGIFGEPENKAPEVSKQTNQQDFFNMSHDDHDEYSDDEAINENDMKYWSELHSLANFHQGINLNETSVDTKSYTNSLVSAANPIRPSTVGNDKSLTDPVSMGATYDVVDLQKLEDLKVKLHNLIDKLNGVEAKGEGVTKIEVQIESLQKKIDEICNSFSKGVPSQQGD